MTSDLTTGRGTASGPPTPAPRPSEVDAPPGPRWCAAWADRLDAAVTSWFAALDAPACVAVIALGSYARRDPCPASDVDLLLVHDGWGGDLSALVQAVCYPLWDSGLVVGHAVRTPREAVDALDGRVDAATAMLDRRLVAGDRGLADALGARLDRRLRTRGPSLLLELGAADRERHARTGGDVGVLEPDLKAHAGGLRDLHSLRWAAGCLLGEVGLDPLVGARYLGASDRRRLAEAGDTLLTARCALHLVRGADRGSERDRLRWELAADVADRLAWTESGGGDGTPADVVVRAVGLACRTIAHVHARVWPRLLADAEEGRRRSRPAPRPLEEGISFVDGLVETDPEASLADDPSLGLRAVAAAAECGTVLGRETAERLRRQLETGGRLRWDGRSRSALLRILACGPRAPAALAEADHVGLVAAHLTDWARVRGRPQHNPLHRYDLDTHLAQAVGELGALVEGAVDEHHGRLWAELTDPDSVRLALWLHDVGKAWPGDHSVVGARLARDWVLRMGFDQRRADRVSMLVRLHLLLPEAALGRDLDDDDEIAAVAARVRDTETLDALYLMSLADARATGPGASSPWKDSLLAFLHGRVRRGLTAESDGPPERTGPGAAVAEARRLAGDARVDVLLRRAPRRYTSAASAAQLVEHALLLDETIDVDELRSRLRPGPVAGTATLSLVAVDHRGLMADCAGVLTGHGLDVLDARAFTRTDGVALDWFVVAEPGGGAHRRAEAGTPEVDWDRVRGDLAAAAAGRLDVDEHVARHERRHPPALPDAGEVAVAFHRGPLTTRIDVRGPDAHGMLYRLARVLADAGLDVVGARAVTTGSRVRDVFFVRPSGGPPDTEALGRRLRSAASGRA